METFFGHKGFRSDKPIVTLGMFDGVHRGHRSLLAALVEKAGEAGTDSVVVTLDPHPRIVLSGGKCMIRYLTSLDEKISLISEAGVDKLVVLPFTTELSRMETCDFIKNYMVDIIGVKHLIVGYDHHFGYQDYDSSVSISKCAGLYGFVAERKEPLKEGKEVISSTLIREKLLEGSLETANRMLGYPYMLKGKVVEGKKIGRLLGYPTANIVPDYSFKLIPADGVYAVEVILDSGVYRAMLYIGPRPTIEKEKGERTIEVNIFDFDEDIYGENIMLRFRHRLRGDTKFSSRKKLLDQIERDKEETMRLLSP
ncbi:MAG: riboflavin biosynthesis protein RibF [Bacteroidota bacterium]